MDMTEYWRYIRHLVPVMTARDYELVYDHHLELRRLNRVHRTEGWSEALSMRLRVIWYELILIRRAYKLDWADVEPEGRWYE